MAHAHKPDFVFRRNGRVRLNRRRRQFSRLLAAEVCASPVVMLDTPCSEVVWRVLATHSIRQFPLHFPSRTSPCAITFQLDSTYDAQQIHLYFRPQVKRCWKSTCADAPHRALLSGSARVSVAGSQSREEGSRTGFETPVFQFYRRVLEYHLSNTCTNFPNSRGHLKILGTRCVTCCRAGEQNLRARAHNVYKFRRNPSTYPWELQEQN